ncbi:MAG: sulfotransferase [Cryomorphaceae bacterium]|nr:sulfotransferase [Cryomorphaceae bacterium]
MIRAFARPFIVIGCHRSGTSWLAAAMHRSGIHMGVDRDHNEEAIHFLSLNQEALQNAGGHWDAPLVPQQDHWTNHTPYCLLKIHFNLHRRRDFVWQIILGKTAWGWKDPRNTFTLSHWLSVYPEAKVIHLVRNADDVVKSLLNRQNTPGEVRSDVQLDKDKAYKLWQQYVDQARTYQAKLKGRFIEISYESLHLPDTHLRLNAFCNKDVGQALTALASDKYKFNKSINR